MSGKPGLSGRPSSYTPEIAALICDGMAAGLSLTTICEEDKFPAASTVVGWARADVCGFREQYAQAREDQAHSYADRIVTLAKMEPRMVTQTVSDKNGVTTTETRIDPGFEAWRKTEIDTLKWVVSKILFRIYGEKLTVDHTVTLDPNRLTDSDLARIASQGKTLDGTATIIGQKVIAA
jgi:hypothetical protein